MLKPSDFHADIESLLVNYDRDSGLVSKIVSDVEITYEGMQGEAHGGLTRLSCSRVRGQYPRNTSIRNVRQISIISLEELAIIAKNLDVPYLEPQWLGANIVVSGIADFSLIPPSSRLISDSGVSLVVDMINGPCRFVGEVIDQTFPGKGKYFTKGAYNLRGVTAWVEKTGTLKAGDSFRLHLPVQPASPHFREEPST